MDPTVFELEIPEEWRFSRISYPGRGPVKWNWALVERCRKPNEQQYKDPMDEEKYKESTAFPLLKPNIEVFGLSPPATVRRQRGWYQRKRWPPTEGKEVIRWTGAATGADVPQELFDNVIRHLSLRNRDKVKASKWELGQVSLVCRRWAKLIRYKIFDEIQLRNRDDVDTLLSFFRCPTSVISNYIESLCLVLSVASYPSPPWIHIVCVFILPQLAKGRFINLTVQGPLPSNKVMKGLHDMLLRSCPYFSSRITSLRVENTQFKSFGHLMGTIGDMPALASVYLHKVTWHRSQDEEFCSPPARRARFRQHPKFIMCECMDDAAVVWLQLLLLPPGSDRLDQIDADRLYRTASLLSNADTSTWRYHVDEGLGPDVFKISFMLPGHKWSEIYVFPTSHVEGQARQIRAISFQSLEYQRLVDIDWKEVDNLIASLSTLEMLDSNPYP